MPPLYKYQTVTTLEDGWRDVKYTDSRNGAGDRNRTRDPLITNQTLYRLSYASMISIGAILGHSGGWPQFIHRQWIVGGFRLRSRAGSSTAPA